ncbi:hypothetical protein E4U58_002485 [Claviceps cyperi]|nr:hypothetical protein E4U58_002485 [Claviceps cyperi]
MLVNQSTKISIPFRNFSSPPGSHQAKSQQSIMPSSCKELRQAVAECLQESDCIMVQRNKPSDCLREPLASTLPTRCQQLLQGYGACKRGMIDMRKRFRSSVPVARQSAECADTQKDGYQLYAGQSAFSGGVKETSGNESIPPDWRDVENEKYRLEQQQLQQQERK